VEQGAVAILRLPRGDDGPGHGGVSVCCVGTYCFRVVERAPITVVSDFGLLHFCLKYDFLILAIAIDSGADLEGTIRQWQPPHVRRWVGVRSVGPLDAQPKPSGWTFVTRATGARVVVVRNTGSTSCLSAHGENSTRMTQFNALGEGQHVYELFSQHNYDLSGDPKNVKQAMRRFIRRVFNVDERGLCEALGQLPGLCDAFNKTPGNGHADLIIVDGVFMGLTIVFDSAVHATMHCGARVFCIDACHLIYERNDLRLGLIEGTLSTNKILPVVVHLGWQESFEFYRDMFTSVQTHRPIFFSHLDSIET
jgi:hypothetical protein